MENRAVEIYEKRAKRWAGFISRLPGVSAVFLSGSLSRGTATAGSDIDFFIVAHDGRIFTARFWTLFFLYLSGNLAHDEKHHAGKICPNHFISSRSYQLREKGEYYAAWLSHLKFLGGDAEVWELVKRANRDWVGKYGFDLEKSRDPLKKRTEKKLSLPGNLLERFFYHVQNLKLTSNPNPLPDEARVWLKDDEIRMHPNAMHNPDYKR